MAVMGKLVFTAFAAVARATHSHSSGQNLRHVGGGSHDFVQPLEFKHRLRVCNAYPSEDTMSVELDGADKLTGDDPMAYKTCREFSPQLKAGDKLEFKIGDTTTGTFSVADLPNNDAVLLLAIHRHDSLSTAVAFSSHVFANTENAQVAILDTYMGKAHATPRIKDAAVANNTRSEELRYNSIVAVNQGQYKLSLDDDAGLEKSVADMVALKRQDYVVLRMGVEAKRGQSFPEELVVFPQSDAKMLPHSGSMQQTPLAFVLVAIAGCLFAN